MVGLVGLVGLAEGVKDVVELGIGVGDVLEFGVGGSDEVGEVLIGCEVAFFDECGDGDLEVDGAEEGVVAFDVFLAFAAGVGGCGGEAEDDGAVEEFGGVGEDATPVAHEVVAFVEDDEADADVAEFVECFEC